MPRTALHTKFRGREFNEVVKRVLEISRSGLAARARMDSNGNDETTFLTALDEINRRGTCPAEVKLEQFNGAWDGNVDPLFTEYAY